MVRLVRNRQVKVYVKVVKGINVHLPLRLPEQVPLFLTVDCWVPFNEAKIIKHLLNNSRDGLLIPVNEFAPIFLPVFEIVPFGVLDVLSEQVGAPSELFWVTQVVVV